MQSKPPIAANRRRARVAKGAPSPTAAAATVSARGDTQSQARPASREPGPLGIHAVYLRFLLDLLRQQGVNLPPLLRAFGPDCALLSGDDGMLDVATLRRIVPAAVQASGRPWLGLELGAAVQVFSHGPLGLAAAASGSLRQALELLARFVALRAPVLSLELRETPAGLRIELGETQPLGCARDFVLEALLVMLERLLQALSGRSLAEASYELAWPEPAWGRHYADFLSGRLRFDARRVALLLPKALADAPCLAADPAALAFARAECERRLSAGAPGRELMAGIRRRLLACEGGYPQAPVMAEVLGLSLRSFHRRLAAEQTSYRSLLEETRRGRALSLLRDTSLPIEVIADRLGYSDASNFSRCVRRWFGCTASELRERR